MLVDNSSSSSSEISSQILREIQQDQSQQSSHNSTEQTRKREEKSIIKTDRSLGSIEGEQNRLSEILGEDEDLRIDEKVNAGEIKKTLVYPLHPEGEQL